MAGMPEELRLAENQILNDGFIYEVVEAPMGFPLALNRTANAEFFEEIILGIYRGIQKGFAYVLPMKVGVVRQKVHLWPFWPRVVFKERHPRGTDTAVRLEELVQELRDGGYTQGAPQA